MYYTRFIGLVFVFLSLAIFITNRSYAFSLSSIKHAKKDSTHLSFIQRTRSYKELDLIDVVRLAIHRKLMAASDSVGKKEKLHISILPAPGYTQYTGVLGVVSGNFAFFVKDEHNLNQSTVSLNVSYTQKKQAIFAMQPNIWTQNDSWNIIGDNRFIKYPQSTFGLGGNTLPDREYTLDYFLIRTHETALKHIVKDFYIGFGYDFDYHFDIKEQSTATNTDYQKYGGGNKSVSSGFKVNLEYDSRRNSINPQGGFYVSIIYGYYFRAIGSDNNYHCLKGDFRIYLPLSKNKRHILALWNYDWFTFTGHAPYLDLPSTAWDDYNATGRGYPQARYRGKNMIDLEAEYRFPLLRNGFLGGVLFSNVESFTDYLTDKFTFFAPAVGLGLRIKLNKRSNTNIAIDYGFGLHGENGLIINVGELF